MAKMMKGSYSHGHIEMPAHRDTGDSSTGQKGKVPNVKAEQGGGGYSTSARNVSGKGY